MNNTRNDILLDQLNEIAKPKGYEISFRFGGSSLSVHGQHFNNKIELAFDDENVEFSVSTVGTTHSNPEMYKIYHQLGKLIELTEELNMVIRKATLK